MARKSPWQEFTENFQSVYGTFKKLGKDIETARIMDDKKFTGEGGLGFGLEDDELEEARYKALGDIYTKYGDADKGLAIRQQLANLEEKKRANDLQAAIFDNQVNIQGNLAELLKKSQIKDTDASANLKGTQREQINFNIGVAKQKLPYELEALQLANTGQRYDNTGKGLSNTGQELLNQKTQLDLNTLRDVEAARNAEKQILTNASDPNWWATQEGFELGKDGKLTREPTEKERNEAIMKMLNSNPNITLKRRLEMDAALGKHGITKLQNKALEVVAEGKLFAQKNLDELIKWYDGVDDGDATSLRKDVAEDGSVKLFRVSPEGETLYLQGRSENEINAQIMAQLNDPIKGVELAGAILDQEKTRQTMEIDGKTFEITKETAEFQNKLTESNITLNEIRGQVAKGNLDVNVERLALEESRLAFDKLTTKKKLEIEAQKVKIQQQTADAGTLRAETDADLAASQKLMNMARQELTGFQIDQIKATTEKVKAETAGLTGGVNFRDVSKAFLILKTSTDYLTAPRKKQEAMETVFWSSFPTLVDDTETNMPNTKIKSIKRVK